MDGYGKYLTVLLVVLVISLILTLLMLSVCFAVIDPSLASK